MRRVARWLRRFIGALVDDVDTGGGNEERELWTMPPEFESFADEAVASWGRPGGDYGYHELEAAIATLYRSQLMFPSAWTTHQRDDFIAERASRDASEASASFDDLIDTVNDRLRRDRYLDCGGQPLNEDIAAEIDLARRDVIDDLGWRMIDEIPDAIRRVDCELADELTVAM